MLGNLQMHLLPHLEAAAGDGKLSFQFPCIFSIVIIKYNGSLEPCLRKKSSNTDGCFTILLKKLQWEHPYLLLVELYICTNVSGQQLAPYKNVL